MRVHEGKGVPMTRFKCDKCDAEFDTKQDFKKHKAPQKFTCEGCKKKGQVFFAENKCEFNKHLKFFDFHKNNDVKNRNLITCLKCKLDFKNSQLLKIHRDHTGKVVCKKPNCGKVFFGTCKLEKHKKFDTHKASNPVTTKTAPKPPPPIIKPAVINLDKLESRKRKVEEHKQVKRNEIDASIITPTLKKTKEKEESSKKHAVEKKNDGKADLVTVTKTNQIKVQNLEKKLSLLDNIQFHYPTFTEQQLLEQGVFDELSSTYFLPPLLPDHEGDDDEDDSEVVTVQEDVPPPDTFDGVCILGF